MSKKILEVIAWSVNDAIKIEEGGADRIELIVDLERGGLTPPIELVNDVTAAVKIPVRIMIRDTDNGFDYDDETMQSHIKFIKKIKETKAEGIVFGSIKNGKINFDQLKQIVEIKGKLKLTFHRAFDTLDIEEAKKSFIKLNNYDVDTLLTSGLDEKTALNGINMIKWLVDNTSNIKILAGKGIDENNCGKIVKYTNISSIHVGSSVRINGVIDVNKVKKIKEIINND